MLLRIKSESDSTYIDKDKRWRNPSNEVPTSLKFIIVYRSDAESIPQVASQSYSIHSPTYLAVQTDSETKQDYFFGPKNMRDSNLFYSSSPMSQPYGSPMSQPFSSPTSSGGRF